MQPQRLSEVSDELRGEWEQLYRVDELATPFLSPAWVLGYWRYYDGGHQPWIITVRTGGELVGMATLTVRRVRAIRRLEALARMGDYWDILARPRCRGGVLDAVAALLRQHGNEWDELSVKGLSCCSATGHALQGVGRAVTHTVSRYPGVELPGSFEEYLLAMRKHRRADIRRHLRRLDGNEVELRPVIAPESVPAAVLRWHQLRTSQWRRQGRKLSSDQRTTAFPAFIRDVMIAFVPSGRAVIWEFYAGQRGLVGSYINFVDRSTCYGYLGGYTPAAANLGVGKIAIAEGIRESIKAQRNYFDFMMGNEPYKYAWFGARDRQVEKLVVRAPRPRALLSLADGALRRCARGAKGALRCPVSRP